MRCGPTQAWGFVRLPEKCLQEPAVWRTLPLVSELCQSQVLEIEMVFRLGIVAKVQVFCATDVGRGSGHYLYTNELRESCRLLSG